MVSDVIVFLFNLQTANVLMVYMLTFFSHIYVYFVRKKARGAILLIFKIYEKIIMFYGVQRSHDFFLTFEW